jgi:hypothetical protein
MTTEQYAGRKKSNKRPIKWIGITVIVIVVLALVNTIPKSKFQGDTEKPVPDFYNIPLMLGKNIDELRRELGPGKELKPEPTSDTEKTEEFWTAKYEKSGYPFLISFDWKTREVYQFFILMPENESYSSGMIDFLIKLAHLNRSDKRYVIGMDPNYGEEGITAFFVKPYL